MNRSKVSLGSLAAAAVALSASVMFVSPAQAAPLVLVTEGSRIEVTSRQMNVPVQAQFTSFRLAGEFDANKLDAANAEVLIDTASFDFGPGAEEYNAEVQAPEWFDAQTYPQAKLVLDAVRAQSPGMFIASGELTIKDVSRPVEVPVTFARDGDARVFSGELTISRLAYNIGTGDWKDTSIVEDDVIIAFELRSK